MTLAFAASLHTTSAATANTTILVGTEDTVDELVYAVTFNGNEINLVTQTNVSNKAPSWLALHPIDNTKLLVVYEGSNKYQNFKIGQDAQDAGVGPAFGVFSNDGNFMVLADFTDGGYVVAQYLANGTSFPIPQEDSPDDPNLFQPNATSPTHVHEFVQHPKLDVGYINNLGANLTSFYQFKDGNLTFQSSLNVSGGPRHMVINKEGTFGWIVTEDSCQIQPVKFDQTGNLTSNGDAIAITQGNQAVGFGGEILLSQDERMIVASNRQTTGSQNDFLTTFEVGSGGQLTNPTTFDTKGQVVRGLAFNNDSSLLVFGHQTNGTIGMFGRDAETNNLTLLTPNLLNLTEAAKIQSPAAPSSFVFLEPSS
ncbi:Lactonase, 7-bladed beta-propeller-domain-containing protein [Russula emetica]|nr:Lactonase, 7-bladed beta-propeller-domain-containing protein [Russula emetica]